jgi:uncharacterized membrane protein
MDKHIIWALCIISIFMMITIMVIVGFIQPFTIRFEMDNNTLEAIKSINWTSLYNMSG